MAGLRAVYDDGKKHSEGKVRGMWSSGIVLETDVQAGIGSPVTLVILSGGFDGTRLFSQVAGVEKNALLLDLPGLDRARWTRLQSLVEGKPVTVALPITPPARSPSPNAPVFIISGGDDELGDPTDAVQLAPLPLTQRKAVPAPSPFQIPAPTDPFARAVQKPVPQVRAKADDDAAEQQLVELGRRNTVLTAENAQLKGEVQRLTGLKSAVEEELTDALARLEAIEKALKR